MRLKQQQQQHFSFFSPSTLVTHHKLSVSKKKNRADGHSSLCHFLCRRRTRCGLRGAEHHPPPPPPPPPPPRGSPTRPLRPPRRRLQVSLLRHLHPSFLRDPNPPLLLPQPSPTSSVKLKGVKLEPRPIQQVSRHTHTHTETDTHFFLLPNLAPSQSHLGSSPITSTPPASPSSFPSSLLRLLLCSPPVVFYFPPL